MSAKKNGILLNLLAVQMALVHGPVDVFSNGSRKAAAAASCARGNDASREFGAWGAKSPLVAEGRWAMTQVADLACRIRRCGSSWQSDSHPL